MKMYYWTDESTHDGAYKFAVALRNYAHDVVGRVIFNGCDQWETRAYAEHAEPYEVLGTYSGAEGFGKALDTLISWVTFTAVDRAQGIRFGPKPVLNVKTVTVEVPDRVYILPTLQLDSDICKMVNQYGITMESIRGGYVCNGYGETLFVDGIMTFLTGENRRHVLARIVGFVGNHYAERGSSDCARHPEPLHA